MLILGYVILFVSIIICNWGSVGVLMSGILVRRVVVMCGIFWNFVNFENGVF